MQNSKQIFKLILGFILFISLVFSCNEDESQVTEKTAENNFTTKRVTLSEVPQILEELEKFTKPSQEGILQFKNAPLDYVDTDDILLLQKEDGSKSFNFIIEKPIDLDAPYILENLVIIENTDGSQSSFITQYIPDNGLYFYSTANFIGNIKVLDLNYNVLFTRHVDGTSDIQPKYVAGFIVGDCAYLVDITYSDCCMYMEILASNCGGGGSSSGGSSGGGSSGGTSGGNTGGGSSTGDGTSSGGGGYSGGGAASGSSATPNTPTEDEVMIRRWNAFIGTLTSQQYNYLGNHQALNDKIFYYLEEHFFNAYSRGKIINLLNFTFQNSLNNIEFYDFLIWSVDYLRINNPDVNYDTLIDYLRSEYNNSATENKITYFPNFQYPEDSNYEEDYPELTILLKEYIPTLSNNQNLINIIHDLTDVSPNKIKNDLQWGDGPIVNIVQLGLKPDGTEIYGKFNPSNPNIINIDIDLVNRLESMDDDEEQQSMLRGMIIYAICLHELVHYLDWEFDQYMQDYPDANIELGLIFEQINNGGYFEIDNEGNVIFIEE